MTSRLSFIDADARTLQLDIDSGDELTQFWSRLKWFSCMADSASGLGLRLRGVSVTKSRHGNWHVEIKLGARLRIIERIALQAILGSDRDRELCNWERYRFHSTYPILFVKETQNGNRRQGTKEHR